MFQLLSISPHSSMGNEISIIAALLLTLCCGIHYYTHTHNQPRHPPGPRGLPIIGNLLELSSNNPGPRFASFAREYGDIFFLTVPGRTVLVINSIAAMKSLLNKQAAAYSDRPVSPFSELYVPFLK